LGQETVDYILRVIWIFGVHSMYPVGKPLWESTVWHNHWHHHASSALAEVCTLWVIHEMNLSELCMYV